MPVKGAAAAAGRAPIASVYAELGRRAPAVRPGRGPRPGAGRRRDAGDVRQGRRAGHEARAETTRGWLFRVAFHEALASRRRQATRDKGHRRLAGFRPGADSRPTMA